jgi:uncharacterized protein (DUF1015 family)
MADIRPFRGLRYSPRFVPDPSLVLCPPYDVISPQTQKALLERSRYNIIHLEYGERRPGDTPEDNRYTRAFSLLWEWLTKGVLPREAEPAFYLHHQTFTFGGKRYTRRVLMAAVELNRAVIRAHEGTLQAPRADRLDLLRATKTNISPVFCLYQDPTGKAMEVFSQAEQSHPVLEAQVEGEEHQLWTITDPGLQRELQELLSPLPLYIADGHHRFSSALAYKEEMERACAPGEEHNFALMGLVEFHDPGLLILPVHRVVAGLGPKAPACLVAVAELFQVQPFPSPVALLEAMTREEYGLGLYCADGFFLLTPLQRLPYEKLLKLLHREVLESFLKAEKVAYTHSAEEAVERVKKGEYTMAFLMNPLKVEAIKAVADAGETLPGKSTYFYPKLPTGLVLRPLFDPPMTWEEWEEAVQQWEQS